MEDEPVEIYLTKKQITDINKVGGINTEKGIFTDSRTTDGGEKDKNAYNAH